MKIGIYTDDLDGLIFLKTVVKELPGYDYELHIDTSYLSNKTDDLKALEEGTKALVEKGSEVIFVLSQDQVEQRKLNMSEKVKIVQIQNSADLKKYLENNPEVENSLSRNQTRNINLTEHTPETDRIVEVLLGGMMLRE